MLELKSTFRHLSISSHVFFNTVRSNPSFRRNHAKGVGVSGFFESNGNGVRLSQAVVFRPGRVPVIGRFSLGGGQPYVGDWLDAVRGLGLQFSLAMANYGEPR